MTRTLTLELADEVAARAEEISKATGRSVSEFVSDLLSSLPEKSEKESQSFVVEFEADLVRASKVTFISRGSREERVLAKVAPKKGPKSTPLVDSLIGILRGSAVDEEDYKRYLESRYL